MFNLQLFVLIFFSMTGSLVLAKKILYKIYDCQFNDFDRLVVSKDLTVRLGGRLHYPHFIYLNSNCWSSARNVLDVASERFISNHTPRKQKHSNALAFVTRCLIG